MKIMKQDSIIFLLALIFTITFLSQNSLAYADPLPLINATWNGATQVYDVSPLYRINLTAALPEGQWLWTGADDFNNGNDFGIINEDGHVNFYHETVTNTSFTPFISWRVRIDGDWTTCDWDDVDGEWCSAIAEVPTPRYPGPIAISNSYSVGFFDWDGNFLTSWNFSGVNRGALMDMSYDKERDVFLLGRWFGQYSTQKNFSWYNFSDNTLKPLKIAIYPDSPLLNNVQAGEAIDVGYNASGEPYYNLVHIGGLAISSTGYFWKLNENGNFFSTYDCSGTGNNCKTVNWNCQGQIYGSAFTKNRIFTVTAYPNATVPRLKRLCAFPAFNLNNYIVFSYAPSVALIAPANNVTLTSSPVTFAYSVNSQGSTISYCNLMINNLTYQTQNNVPELVNQSFTQVLTNGNYNWSVACMDAKGRIGYSAGRTLAMAIPNSPPVLQPIGNQDVNATQTLTIQLYATDADEDNLTYFTNAGAILPGKSSFNSSTGLFSWTPYNPNAGEYSVTFNVTDGQAWDSETITINVLHYGPLITLLQPLSSYVADQSPVEFSYTVNDEVNVDYCRLVRNKAFLQEDDNVSVGENSSFIQVVENGEYLWAVSCTDALGRTDVSEYRFLNVSLPSTCTDSDGGLNFLVRGTVWDLLSNKTSQDFCSNNVALVEYYCSDGEAAFENFDCTTLGNYTCSEGACILGKIKIPLPKFPSKIILKNPDLDDFELLIHS
jgi:hypothetical protein